MIYWFFITLGTIFCAITLSNKLYYLIFSQLIKDKKFFIIYKRYFNFFFLILGIVSIFLGLYIESL